MKIRWLGDDRGSTLSRVRRTFWILAQPPHCHTPHPNARISPLEATIARFGVVGALKTPTDAGLDSRNISFSTMVEHTFSSSFMFFDFQVSRRVYVFFDFKVAR
jgi:hypothetical protein